MIYDISIVDRVYQCLSHMFSDQQICCVFFLSKWDPESRSPLFFSQQFSEFLWVSIHSCVVPIEHEAMFFRHMVPPKIPMAGLPGHVTFPCRHQADLDQKHQAGGEVELHFWDASRGEPLVEWGSFLPGGPCGVHGKVAGVPSCWVFLTRTFFRAQKRIRTNHCESGDVSWQETWRRPKRPQLINPQWTLASTRDTGKGWNGIIRHPPSAPGSVVFQAFHHLRGQRKYPLVI